MSVAESVACEGAVIRAAVYTEVAHANYSRRQHTSASADVMRAAVYTEVAHANYRIHGIHYSIHCIHSLSRRCACLV